MTHPQHPGGRPAWGALVVLALLAACGSPDEPARPSADAGRPPRMPDRTPAVTPAPGVVSPAPGSARRRAPWRLAGQRDGGRTLVLEVQAGGPPCDAVTAVEVDERPQGVTVTVRTGPVRGARCTGVPAVLGTFRVEARLREPLGDRRLIGSR